MVYSICAVSSTRIEINVPLIFLAGAFESEDITHVDGDVNPVRDLQTISDELRLKGVCVCKFFQ
jgi:ribosome-binding ATPase YchF (GTP1/OBG family)